VNVPGVGGSIGIAKMVSSKPDGTTVVGVWTGPVSIAPHTLGVSYKPGDYTPVILFSTTPYLLCTTSDFPANTGPELVALLKENPNKYAVGTDGPGGLGQLAATRVFRAIGTTQRDIPFKGGGEMVPALLGKHVDLYAGTMPPVLQQVKSGAVKCQIVTSAKRVSTLPNASSLTDLGIPGEETLLWRAILAPRDTPPETIAKLEKAFEDAARSPAGMKFMDDVGESLSIMKGRELAAYLQREYDKFGEVVRAVGMDRKN
jgi:tripartite-type tricarboxylate transporter receptor subunit TctC